MNTINELIRRIVRFRDSRDWKQFHTPANLASALTIEAGELQEIFLWKTEEQIVSMLRNTKARRAAEEEIADVLIYALLFCHETGINPATAIGKKLALNARKYPIALAKGRAEKYTVLHSWLKTRNAARAKSR